MLATQMANGLNNRYKLSVRLDTQRHETLKQVCAKTGRDVTGVVRLALDMFFDLKNAGNADGISAKAAASPEPAAPKLTGLGLSSSQPPLQPQREQTVQPTRTGVAQARLHEPEPVRTKANGSAVPEPATQGIEETVPEIPEAVTAFVSSLRVFGGASWVERRRRFLTVIALARICWETSGEDNDAAILADFLALGRKYRMF
jgi:hypothetical protein